MNVETIKIDPDVAKVKAKRYARELRALRDKDVNDKYRQELNILRKAYRELAKGTKVLHLDQIVQAAGFDENMHPRVAIARSDKKICKFIWHMSSPIITFDSKTDPLEKTAVRNADVERLHNKQYWVDSKPYGYWQNSVVAGYSAVPEPPLDIRPEGADLKKFYTLWEVTKWFKNPNLTDIERDPYLLKYLGGPFYAVIAEWELSDLELGLQKWMKTN